MKLVSSSYFKKAEHATQNALPFVRETTRILKTILHNKEVKTFPLVRGGKSTHHVLVVVSGNRGLCGGFNVNIGRTANAEIARLQKEGKTVSLMCFGEKALSGLHPQNRELVEQHIVPEEKVPWVYASTIVDHIIKKVHKEEVGTASIVYTAFQSMLVSTIKAHSLIPFEDCLLENNKNFKEKEAFTPPLLFGVEPSYLSLVKKASENHLKSQLYFAMLESRASEESARMIAMDGATKSSEDMLAKLYVTYNRNRQAAITSELIEIISGAESV